MGRRATVLVGQSGGPTAVTNCTLAGVLETAASDDRVERVLGMRHGIEGLLEGSIVDLTHESPTQRARLRRTPSAALGSGRYRLTDNDLDAALDALQRIGVDVFLYVGGNDSADTTHRLALAAQRAGRQTHFLGLPKTVDNDLVDTDHCPGYGSAARFVAFAAQEVGTDTAAMRRTDPVRFLEVMGRYAGWLAAAAVLGRTAPGAPPHMVLLPEAPLSESTILERIQRSQAEHGSALVVISENQPDPDGTVLGSASGPEYVDAFGHEYYSSPAQYLARRVQEELQIRARVDRPGSVQRSSIGLRSRVDADEAEQLGRAAIPLAMAGHTDEMLVLLRVSDGPYRCEIGLTPLERIAGKQRLMPPEFVDDSGEPSAAFAAYALPLIGPRPPRHYRYV